MRSKKTGEISVDVECARLLLPAETEELEKNIQAELQYQTVKCSFDYSEVVARLVGGDGEPELLLLDLWCETAPQPDRYCAVPALNGTEANMYSLFRNGTRAQCLRRRQVSSAHLLRTVTVGIRRCALLPMQMRMTESILPNRS